MHGETEIIVDVLDLLVGDPGTDLHHPGRRGKCRTGHRIGERSKRAAFRSGKIRRRDRRVREKCVGEDRALEIARLLLYAEAVVQLIVETEAAISDVGPTPAIVTKGVAAAQRELTFLRTADGTGVNIEAGKLIHGAIVDNDRNRQIPSIVFLEDPAPDQNASPIELVQDVGGELPTDFGGEM